jgi:hypothetical protein
MLLNEQPCIELEKEEARINADISSFISHEVKKLCYSSGLENGVHQKLLTGSGAIFLWVSLVIDELKETPIQGIRRH